MVLAVTDKFPVNFDILFCLKLFYYQTFFDTWHTVISIHDMKIKKCNKKNGVTVLGILRFFGKGAFISPTSLV